jgi:hypothetical protein
MPGSAVTPPRVSSVAGRPPRSLRTQDPTAGAAPRRALPLGLLACLALAALTLLAPSAPTYDPWAWIVWGREILHLDLNTVAGPSWKPLPVAFTTVFALFGSAAPTLWVLVARAGAFYGALAAYRLAVRLGGGVPGGVAAAAGVLVAPWYLRNGALANSEGLQVAFALVAVERHLAGSRRGALLAGLGLALMRPEAWPFLGLYGLWLAWRDRGELVPVALSLASLPLLWLAPEHWGSGDWLRAAHRAQQPVGNSPAFADNPVREVLSEGAAMLTTPVWIGLAALAVLALRQRDRRVAALAAGVMAWTLLVAAMTANGYSGNTRYLIVPAALVVALAGAGVGRVAALVPGRAAVAVAAVLAAVAFVLPTADRVRPTLRGTDYQARLADELGGVVAQAGGADRLRACGTPYTGAYLVPAVAWQLHLHTNDVKTGEARAPAVVFRVRTTQSTHPVPPLGALTHAPTLASAPKWRIVAACR